MASAGKEDGKTFALSYPVTLSLSTLSHLSKWILRHQGNTNYFLLALPPLYQARLDRCNIVFLVLGYKYVGLYQSQVAFSTRGLLVTKKKKNLVENACLQTIWVSFNSTYRSGFLTDPFLIFFCHGKFCSVESYEWNESLIGNIPQGKSREEQRLKWMPCFFLTPTQIMLEQE